MLYREIITVSSQVHTEHINTLCGQNVEMLNVKLVVHIITTERLTVNRRKGARGSACVRARLPTNERTVNLHRASCTLTTADTYLCDRCAFCDTVLCECVCQHLN
jgi:hypothetical protein